MLYAASEITFLILLAALVGGAIGWGVAQANSLRLNQRLAHGRADAPMERELATAWETIEDLNRRLQVAHETIRSAVHSEPEDAAPAPDESTGADFETAAEGDPVVFDGDDAADDPVGERLSQRVASASIANQSDVEIKF